MNRNPKHIGIIPDGNRRWAVRNGFQKQDGYSYGLTPALRLLIAARERGIRELTYYGFTVDNCKRPRTQVTAFTDACLKAAEIIEREGASLYVVGNTESGCFPRGLLPYASRPNAENKMRINLLVNYGWEWDMKNGWASHEIPRIDLVIRWGGMSRLSGFLPIQTVYSDLYIVKDLWPDFQENQFEEALEWYHRQDVTLGG